MLEPARLTLVVLLSPLALAAQDTKPAAQEPRAPLLRAGDPAPPLSVESFLRGEPVAELKRGQIYVVEFWATWCGPCIGAMPHLSDLQAKYRDDGVTVIGVDVWEDRGPAPRSEADVRAFVERQGDLMAYHVAYDGKSGHMAKAWLDAAGQRSIPATFVVDQSGKLAWIGHPDYVALVVQQLVRGTWDPAQGAAAIEAARAALRAACAKYATGLEDGDRAWAAAATAHPEIAPRFVGRRYADMLAAGHDQAAYALGRTMLAAAKAQKNSVGLMDIVMPMLDTPPPKTIDRELAMQVAEAVLALGDPTDPGRHISLAQIHFGLRNLEEGRKHKAKALGLIPAAARGRLQTWLDRLESDAAKN